MIAADLIALLHAAFICFVTAGALRGYRRLSLNWFLFACGAALIAQMIVSKMLDVPCIFTIIEANLRPASDSLREEGFVVFYLHKLGLPFTEKLTEALHMLFAAGAMLRARPICYADLRVRLWQTR